MSEEVTFTQQPELEQSQESQENSRLPEPTLQLEDEQEQEEAEDLAEEALPEKYEAFRLPEDVVPDPELEKDFCFLAQELGLSQQQAQKAVDWYLEKNKLQGADALDRQEEYLQSLKEQTITDPEIGGARWEKDAQVSVRLALEKLGTPELKEVIAQNPALAVHPEIIRFFKRAGDLLREGQTIEARTGVQPRSAADVLFGD